MKKLNCNDISSLTKRIILQKKIYLLQKLGFDLGYGYQWYWYGPYSVSLNLDSFNTNPQIDSTIQINEEQNIALERLHSFSKQKKDNLRFLETAASLVFLKGENPFYDDKQLVESLVKLKNHVNSKEAEEVLIRLKAFKII